MRFVVIMRILRIIFQLSVILHIVKMILWDYFKSISGNCVSLFGYFWTVGGHFVFLTSNWTHFTQRSTYWGLAPLLSTDKNKIMATLCRVQHTYYYQTSKCAELIIWLKIQLYTIFGLKIIVLSRKNIPFHQRRKSNPSRALSVTVVCSDKKNAAK